MCIVCKRNLGTIHFENSCKRKADPARSHCNPEFDCLQNENSEGSDVSGTEL